MSNNESTYDYIIAGGGMAGLSLAYKLCKAGLVHKKILILDKEPKTKNDRTWGFWEQGNSIFDEIAHLQWKAIKIVDYANTSTTYPLQKHTYKVIRGLDFYTFINAYLKKCINVTFVFSDILEIKEKDKTGFVHCENGTTYSSSYIFDSISKLDLSQKGRLHFLQHFYGQVIRFEQDTFDTSAPEMMNYDVTQLAGECRFMYLIPISKTEAILEFTLFSEKLLEEVEYKHLLNSYLQKRYKGQPYTVLEEEFGVIPMSNTDIDIDKNSKIIKIGTSAGSTHPATGYTFAAAQKHIDNIVVLLKNGKSLQNLKQSLSPKHKLYASTLLQVMKNKELAMDQVFIDMFKKNKTDDVFDFLGGESSFVQELGIMWNTPIIYFGKAFVQSAINNLK